MTRAMLALAVLVGCNGPSTDECLSGSVWTGGNQASPLMNPGQQCIDCHEAEREGPVYVIAGTVYGGASEPDDCDGIEGATVEVTDADGTVFTMTANAAGNFFLRASGNDVVFPVTAKVTSGDKTSEMVTAQATGECNSCHGETPSNGAPGRIFVQ